MIKKFILLLATPFFALGFALAAIGVLMVGVFILAFGFLVIGPFLVIYGKRAVMEFINTHKATGTHMTAKKDKPPHFKQGETYPIFYSSWDLTLFCIGEDGDAVVIKELEAPIEPDK